jgi:peptidylprolyl isomerase
LCPAGPLAFPKGLASAPGRPRVPPGAEVVFDVSLRYIPGADLDAGDDDEDYVLEI